MAARQSKTGLSVEGLKASELYGVIGQAIGESQPLSDPVILQALFAAEDFYERDLAMRFAVTKVYSRPEIRLTATDPELHLAAFNDVADIADPGYDYSTYCWEGDLWALTGLRYRPIKRITKVVFTWAGSPRVWVTPLDWIHVVPQYGQFQIVPNSGPAVIRGFTAYLLSVIAGGRGIPLSVLVDYEIGFGTEQLQHHHQDLLRGVSLRTLLMLGGILSNAASGGAMSASLGLDGMSRSRGFGGKYGAYSGAITIAMEQEEAIRNAWKTREQGVPVAFA